MQEKRSREKDLPVCWGQWDGDFIVRNVWHWCVFYGRFLAPFWYATGHDKNLLALVGEYLREILETVFISIRFWGVGALLIALTCFQGQWCLKG